MRADLSIVTAGWSRSGRAMSFGIPGGTELHGADVIVATKVRSARPDDVVAVKARCSGGESAGGVAEADLAATLAAKRYGAREIVDPQPHAVGTVAEVLAKYPALRGVLPALGYSAAQRSDLAETVARCGAEVVLDGSPARIDRVIAVTVVRVGYRFEQLAGGRPGCESRVDAMIAAKGGVR